MAPSCATAKPARTMAVVPTTARAWARSKILSSNPFFARNSKMTQDVSNRRGRFRATLLAVGLFLLCAGLIDAGRVAAQELKAAKAATGEGHAQEWTSFYGNSQAWSYSPLAQITRD